MPRLIDRIRWINRKNRYSVKNQWLHHPMTIKKNSADSHKKMVVRLNPVVIRVQRLAKQMRIQGGMAVKTPRKFQLIKSIASAEAGSLVHNKKRNILI